jgi:hypothetical protein
LPLAFLVTVANVAEVTVGLKVVDRVRVPRPKGRPKKRPTSLAADKSYDRLISGGSFAGEVFSRLFQDECGKTAAAGQGDLLWYINSARVAGRWNAATGG